MNDYSDKVKESETTLHLREQGEELELSPVANEVMIPAAEEAAKQSGIALPGSANSKTIGGSVSKRRKVNRYLLLAVLLLFLSVGVVLFIRWANVRFMFQTAPQIANKVLLSPSTRELLELNGAEWDPNMDGFSGIRKIRFVSHKPVTLRDPSKWQYHDRVFYSTHYDGYKQDVVKRMTSQFPFDKDIQKMKDHIDSIEMWSGKGYLLHDKTNDLYLFYAEI
ncbi:MAG: hypothetical protein K2Z81_12240 [Cyanobacteria bacterium]|nr:hypothetical protein [Cyanobacteriota bacterium]